jgi:phage terminase large subunit-like protein
MLGCETYKHSVAEKIEPMLRWLVPSTCQPVFKPGPTGVLNILTLPFDAKGGKCGSKMHIRSYDEQASTYEGQDYDFQHWDEPPPEDILVAAERGKIVTNAPSWFTMTPLKSPFIFDRFSSRAAIHA